MPEKDTIDTTVSDAKDKVNDKINDGKDKVDQKIGEGKDKVDTKIDERKEKFNRRMDQSKNFADKMASDLTKGVDDLFFNVKSAQESINNKINDYKKTLIQSLTIDLVEDDTTYYIKVAVPGISKDDVDINAGDYEINIQADFPAFTDEIDSDETLEVIVEELDMGRCVKNITFENQIDIDNITAKFQNGAIFITIPKIQAPKQKIDVE